ncbi:MAG: hypothetical protein ACXABK_00310 [Candidatus Heimdallarchaeaceae archaeon]|jgi:hypothetical protein
MLFSKETIELLRDSPFKQFVLMELERERIYQSFIEIDELDEISEIWSSFSKICADSLSDVSSLADLLYRRFLDEWTRDKAQISEDKDREEKLTFKIENLQEFQMELAILMIVYADIVNSGIFESKPSPEYSSAFVEGYRILNSISQTYFDSTHPRASSIEEVMLAFLLLSQKQQVIQKLEEAPESEINKEIIEEKGAYELALSEFENSFTSEFLNRLGKDWWWRDPIASHFALEKGLSHLENAREYYTKLPEDPELKARYIENGLIPINQALRNKELIDHYLRLSFEAAKNDIFIASFEYLNLVLGLEREALEIISSSTQISESNKALKEEIIKQETIHKFYQGIAELAAKTSQLISIVSTANKKDIKNLITQIEEIVNKPELKVNINYASSLPFVYLNYVQEFKIALLENIPYSDAVKRAELNFERFVERLEFATNDIAQELLDLDKKGKKIKIDKILHLLDNIRNIKLAAHFLPKTENKVYIVKDIECLEFIANSLHLEQYLLDKQKNEVLDLIYHAKAHYYSTKALEISQLSSTSKIDRKWVESRYSQTFIRGQDVELRLFELTRQFLFLNTVIDKLAQGYKLAYSSEPSVKENYQAIINNIFSHFSLFDAINSRISEDCKDLLEHKEMFLTDDSEVNWTTIEVKKNLANALVDFLEATKKAILGFGANTSKETYKATTYFNDSAKHAKFASDTLQLIARYDQAFAQLAKSAYEYSILLKDLERESREEKKLESLPIEQLFNVLKQLTFLS